MSAPRSTPRRRLASLAGVTSVLLLTTMLAAAPAPAQVACDPAELPTVIPQEDLLPGVTGTGSTTLSGTEPVDFTYEVIGTIPDGWMLDLDAIVIEITGPPEFLGETGGAFYGMSGSPAYVGTDLAGAVSGGFVDDPTFALLTPAQAMLDLLETGPAPALAERVVPTDRVRRAIARIQGESVSSVTGVFEQLPIPLGVSGLSKRQAARLQGRLNERGENFHVYRTATASPSPSSVVSAPIEDGTPIGAAVSYGDASIYATGTATFSCGDYVAAFGHPFFSDAPGPISLGLSAAEALMVISPPAGYAGFRYDVLTEPRGTIVQDRFAGILGVIGMEPETTVPITSDFLNDDTDVTRPGETDAIHTWGYWLEEIVWTHVAANFAAVFGRYGGGSTQLEWTLTGNGETDPFTVTNSTMVSSRFDASESIWALLESIDALQFNGFEDVTFDGIDLTGSITEERLEGSIGLVRLSSTKQPNLRARDIVKAAPGDIVTVEVTFDMWDGSTDADTYTIVVPRHPKEYINVKMHGGRGANVWGAGSFEELVSLLNSGDHPDELIVTGGTPKQVRPQGFVVRGKTSFQIRTSW